AALGVKGFELAGQLPGENDAAGGREHAGEAWNVAGHFPLGLSSQRVNRLEMTARSITPLPGICEVHAKVKFSRLIGHRLGLVVATERQRVGVSDAGLRIVGHRLPVLAAK